MILSKRQHDPRQLTPEDFYQLNEKQARDDRRALKHHLSIANSFDKKMKNLEALLKDQVVCSRKLSSIDEVAVRRRLNLGKARFK